MEIYTCLDLCHSWLCLGLNSSHIWNLIQSDCEQDSGGNCLSGTANCELRPNELFSGSKSVFYHFSVTVKVKVKVFGL